MQTTVDSSSRSIQPDSSCALKDLPHSFVVKVRRRPRRAVALLLLQLSRRRRLPCSPRACRRRFRGAPTPPASLRRACPAGCHGCGRAHWRPLEALSGDANIATAAAEKGDGDK